MGDLGPLFVMLLVFGLIARTVTVAKRQQSATRRISAPGTVDAGAQPMLGLLAEMRRELELARRRQAGETRTTPPKPNDPSRRIRPTAAPRLARSTVVAVESIRPTRAVVDYDSQAAKLVASRTAAAELTAEGRPSGAHKSFEARIREVGAPVAPRNHPLGRLRTAMIWREILGPPVSLQPPPE
jgi:hypothetical protein